MQNPTGLMSGDDGRYLVVHLTTIVHTKVLHADVVLEHHYTGSRHYFLTSSWALLKNLP